MRRRGVVSAVVALTMLVACATAVAGGLPTALVSDGSGYKVKPTTIYDTGDGSGVLGVLRGHGQTRGSLVWKSWTASTAVGAGTYWIKLGTPIATSPFTREPVTVTLSRVRSGWFTRMNLRYRQSGRNANVTLCVPDAKRVSEWGTLLKGKCLT